ncbi:MAG: hypothetical protein AB1656_20670 [Candidatus Omnitrophota bacterium]
MLESVADILCTNNPYRGDVLLAIFVDRPLEFQCSASLKAPAPKGYIPQRVEYHWSASSGKLSPQHNRCSWIGAAPGVQTIQASGKLRYLFSKNKGGEPTEIIVSFHAELSCLIPIQTDLRDGSINGFQIGTYPNPNNPNDLQETPNKKIVQEHKEIYTPPTLFYEVTPETFFLRVFDEYALGEFDLDPRFISLSYPHYIAIHPNILTKMSLLKKTMLDEGIKVSKFNIIYFYRSPAYNLGAKSKDGKKSLKSSFSMHMYGLAVDFVLDEDGDLAMDDLNGDGRIDIKDARKLRRYVHKLDKRLQQDKSPLLGAAFVYPHHDFWERGDYIQTPYVHMDARGYARDDGTLIYGEYSDTISITKDRHPYKLNKAIPPWPFPSP